MTTHHGPGEVNGFGDDEGIRNYASTIGDAAPGTEVLFLAPEDPMDTAEATPESGGVAVDDHTPSLRGLRLVVGDRLSALAERLAQRHGLAKRAGPTALSGVLDWPPINRPIPEPRTLELVEGAKTDAGTFTRQALTTSEVSIEEATARPEKPAMPDGYYMETRLAVGAQPFEMFELRPIMGTPNTVMRVYHGSHERNAVANKLEVDTMVRLGDERESSEQEFVPYFPKSFVVEQVQKLEDGTEVSKGMIRVVPADEEGMAKTFVDVAAVTQHPDTTYEARTAEEVRAEFIRDSGCTDTTKVWDVATFAFAEDVDEREQVTVMHNLLVALNQVCAPRIVSGELTHMVSSNHPRILNTLIGLGYPMRDINGYDDMKFVLNEDSDQAMTCHPAFFNTSELYHGFYNAQRPTSHQRKLQKSLEQVEMPAGFDSSALQAAA